jgi:hypothetical protein
MKTTNLYYYWTYYQSNGKLYDSYIVTGLNKKELKLNRLEDKRHVPVSEIRKVEILFDRDVSKIVNSFNHA